MTAATRIADAEFLRRPGVARIMALLSNQGEEARVVGGAVRNHLLGLPIADIDLCTTALPDVVMSRAMDAGLNAVPTGYEHGTVTIIVAGVAHEVTSLRKDIATDGRRAKVKFGRSFEDDALRRDFTINALSVDRDGQVFDYAGGLEDIAARRIRFIGVADQRICEDYLRILRFFRFSAAYGTGSLDQDGMTAVLRNRAGLASLSRERVRQEMMKLLVAPLAGQILAIMDVSGLLGDVLGQNGDVPAFAAMVAQEQAAGLPADAVRRLGALGVRSLHDVARLRVGLRLTNREEAHLSAILPGLNGKSDEASLKVALYRLEMPSYGDAVLMQAAANHDRSGRSAALSLPGRWPVPKFLITGADVMASGVTRGPEVGRRLAEIEARWIAAGMPEGREAQTALLSGFKAP